MTSDDAIRDYARRLVAGMPPLTEQQRDTVGAIFRAQLKPAPRRKPRTPRAA